MSNSTSPLEPARGAQDGDGLVHDPFTDTEVVLDPLLDVLVVGELVGVEAGAVTVPRRPQKGARGKSVSICCSPVLQFCGFHRSVCMLGRRRNGGYVGGIRGVNRDVGSGVRGSGNGISMERRG